MINYYSIENKIMNEIIVNKSKFLTYLLPITSSEEFEETLSTIKKEHYKANHHCSAYILGADSIQQKAQDDGEPSGTAGYPMLEVLKQNNLTNIAAIVVRYFGGVKLGTGGLIRAYSTSVSEALNLSTIIMNITQNVYEVAIPYQNNDILQYYIEMSDLPIQILNTQYTDKITYQLALNPNDDEIIFENLRNKMSGNIDYHLIEKRDINIHKK